MGGLYVKYQEGGTIVCFVNRTHAGSAQAQDCGEVSITEMDWGSAVIVTQVAKFLLEQGYGCSVTVVPLHPRLHSLRLVKLASLI